MIKKTISFLTTFLIVILLFSNVASANHYIWLIDDPNKQSSSFTGPETRISWWMMNASVTVRTSDSTIKSYVDTAVTNWNNKIPQVKIIGSGSDLQFVESSTNCSVDSVACYSITSTYYDTDRDANFTLSARISLKPTSVKKVSDIAHEIGHYVGLHEVYKDDGSTGSICNAYVYSVMDGGGCEDIESPSDWDKQQVDGTLGGAWGQATSIQTVKSGSNIYVRWQDQSLGEKHYIVEYYQGTTFLYSKFVTKNTGLRSGLSWTSNRIIEDIFSTSGRTSGTYKAVITPYYESYGKRGVQNYTTFSF